MANGCETPGEKIRSKGKGRGLARGGGKGPMGRMLEELTGEVECETPGEKKKSKGKGRGEARGKGKGPMGRPFGEDEEKSAYYKLGQYLALRQAGLAKTAETKIETVKTKEMPPSQYKGKTPKETEVSLKKAPNRLSTYTKTIFPSVK